MTSAAEAAQCCRLAIIIWGGNHKRRGGGGQGGFVCVSPKIFSLYVCVYSLPLPPTISIGMWRRGNLKEAESINGTHCARALHYIFFPSPLFFSICLFYIDELRIFLREFQFLLIHLNRRKKLPLNILFVLRVFGLSGRFFLSRPEVQRNILRRAQIQFFCLVFLGSLIRGENFSLRQLFFPIYLIWTEF